MKKRNSTTKTDSSLTARKAGASTVILVIDTPRSTIASKAMTRSDAAAIKDMLIKKIGTMSSLLITTDAGDVIVGGEALRQSVIRFQEITGSEDVMALLLVQINAIVADSTHPLARDFDAKGWLEN